MRKWLITIGLAAVALLAFSVVTGLWSASSRWMGQLRMDAIERKQTRTHPRALLARAGILEADAVAALLPFPSPPAGDGLRYIDMPSFADWYSVTLQPDASGGAQALAAVIHPMPHMRLDQPPPVTLGAVERFHVPPTAFRALVQRLDQLDHGWRGDSDNCFDGTVVAFERLHQGKPSSAVGNASCSAHYGALQSAVFRAVTPFSATARLPRNSN